MRRDWRSARWSWRLPVVMFSPALLGCASDMGGASLASVRDSAGVRVIEFSGSALAAAPQWVLAEQPDLAIDNREAEEAYQLYRVAAAVAMPDGGVVIANGGTSELRYFDGRGAHVRTVGRQGSGPGEFGFLRWLELRADTLVVYDQRTRRITEFDAAGQIVGEVTSTVGSPLREGWSAPAPIGVFGDGSIVASTSRQPTEMDGLYRPETVLYRFDRGTAVAAELARVPGDEIHFTPSERGIALARPIFGRAALLAVGPEALYVSDNDRWEIRVYAPAGALEAVLRSADAPIAVTDAIIETHLDDRFSAIDDAAARDRAMVFARGLVSHTTLPALADVRVGSDGRLWVRDVSIRESDAAQWTVFDDGRPAGRLTVPPGHQVLRFGPDFVLVLVRDDLDRENVRRYRLTEVPAS